MADTIAINTNETTAKPASPSLLKKCIFMLVILAIGFAGIEICLWTFAPVADPYAVSPSDPDVKGANRYLAYEMTPGLVLQGTANPEFLPGIEGDVTVTLNEFGFRSPRLTTIEKPEGTTRIMCIGGSTTACTNLDDKDTWCEKLQQILEKQYPDRKFDVINCGINGQSSRGDINLLAHRVLTFEPDLVINLTGLNEWMYTTRGDYSPIRTGAMCYKAGNYEYLRNKLKWMGVKEKLCSSQLFRRIINAKRNLSPQTATADAWDISGNSVQQRRIDRRNKQTVLLPEELKTPRKEYQQNLRSLIGLCHAHDTEILFVTQPVLWQADMPESHANLCWMGYRGPNAYPFADLAFMVDAYNKTLIQLSQNQNVPIVDAASVLPRDTTIFFDDCHFNIPGAQRLAETIAPTVIQTLN